MTDNLPTWAREALERAEVSPGLQPYITARGGVVVLNGPFPLKQAYAAQDHVMCARADILRLCAALAEALAALEPLAKAAVLFGSATPDSHIINTSLHSNVRIYQATITVGDARRAAEMLDDQVRDEMPEVDQ